MIDSNYLIINRRPERFSSMIIAGKTAVFKGENGRPVDFGVMALDDSVYAALCCDEVCNVTMVTDRDGVINVVTILWKDADDYKEGLEQIGRTLGRRVSVQNKKLNRYAESIAEKLHLGIRLRVTDAVDESKMAVCPECGMLNPPGSEYCLDCGAEIG